MLSALHIWFSGTNLRFRMEAILSTAASRWGSRPRPKSGTAEVYVSRALGGEFDDLDRAYYDAQPPMTQLLENYLDLRRDEFVLLEG